ncbi:hypothetical protein [Candidatus Methanomassiliicoccus intestinalis]|jgi:hypothetical protein|uniref:hypothetical protein n=1 Tax=Candidatus Methanomassiliicoccus intestinalis TaxID=1406512 RepID=UPI0037DD4808
MSRKDSEKEDVAISVQRIQSNQSICLKNEILKRIGAEPGDFVSIIDGPEPNTILIKLAIRGEKEKSD